MRCPIEANGQRTWRKSPCDAENARARKKLKRPARPNGSPRQRMLPRDGENHRGQPKYFPPTQIAFVPEGTTSSEAERLARTKNIAARCREQSLTARTSPRGAGSARGGMLTAERCRMARQAQQIASRCQEHSPMAAILPRDACSTRWTIILPRDIAE
jgi:hypothetical protein